MLPVKMMRWQPTSRKAEITRERVLELMAGGKELADLTSELEELARTSA